MSEEENKALQQRGANARAMGRTISDNPFYSSSEMPRSTGEDVEAWVAKVQAWELGWRVEDMMRPA